MQDPKNILSQCPTEVLSYLQSHNINTIDGDIRPWGGYIHLEPEADIPYSDKKILWINPSKDINNPVTALSLQFHGINGVISHEEKFTPITDMAFITGKNSMQMSNNELDKSKILDEVENNLDVVLLKSGQTHFTKGGIIHAYVNPFYDKLVLLEEIRISKVNQSADDREANICRVYDAKRETVLGEYPKKLLQRVVDLVLE